MPIMLSKTYVAFKAASVSDAEAEAAAEELAAYETAWRRSTPGWAAWRAASRVSAESRLVWGEVGRVRPHTFAQSVAAQAHGGFL